MGTGSAELLEIQRAAKFWNVLWISSLALVLHSGTTSHLGYPPAFFYSWLCAGTKKVSHLSNGSDLDSVGVQVISSKSNYRLSLVVYFSKLMSPLEQKKHGIQVKRRRTLNYSNTPRNAANYSIVSRILCNPISCIATKHAFLELIRPLQNQVTLHQIQWKRGGKKPKP